MGLRDVGKIIRAPKRQPGACPPKPWRRGAEKSRRLDAKFPAPKLKLDLTFKRAGCCKLLIQWIFYRRLEVEARLFQVISQVGKRERGSRLSAANPTTGQAGNRLPADAGVRQHIWAPTKHGVLPAQRSRSESTRRGPVSFLNDPASGRRMG